MKIPYSRQTIDDTDIQAVIDILKTDMLTTGPKVESFEKSFAEKVGSKYAVAVSSGTAGLHLACIAAGLEKGDELITSPITFAASSNCALYCGAKPIFVDVNPRGLIDYSKIESNITHQTKIILPVHYSGLPCDLKQINDIAKKHNLIIIEDACHALGTKYEDCIIGSCLYSDMCVFSFHPIKLITSGEGGMITTNNKEIYEKLIMLRNHGITKDKSKFINNSDGSWYYEMQDLGFNYRISDIQCALGLNQLRKMDSFLQKRREIAAVYESFLKNIPELEFVKELPDQLNSYHLFVVLCKDSDVRKKLYNFLKENSIFCQVHYIPVYWHPYYTKLGYEKGLCPNAEKFYELVISLPIFPLLDDENQSKVIKCIKDFFENG